MPHTWRATRGSQPNSDRLQHRPALHALLKEIFKDLDAVSAAEKLMRAGVPAAAVMNVKEILEHPHTAHRKMVVQQGDYRAIASPIKLSRTPATLRKLPPGFKGA